MREYHYAIILRRKRFRSSCSAKVGTRAPPPPPKKKKERRKKQPKEGGGGGGRGQEKRDFLFTPPSPGLFVALVPAFSKNWHGNACYVSY